MKLKAAVYGAAAAAGACAVAFLAFAAFLGLSGVVAPAYAALLTGAVMLLAAVAVPAVARWVNRSRQPRGEELRGDRLAERIEEVLALHANPAVDDWIRRHPDGAVALTLALGIAAGYSDTARRVLQDLYEEYSVAERARRRSRTSAE